MKGAIGGFLSKIGFDSKTDATKPAAQRVETASTEPCEERRVLVAHPNHYSDYTTSY